MEIITSENYINKNIGTKAYNLFLMKSQGINVPKLFCVQDVDEIEIQKYLNDNFKESSTFAIRSSSSFEDGTEKSFAGQFNTFLNITYNDVISKIKECKESRVTEGLKKYIKRQI